MLRKRRCSLREHWFWAKRLILPGLLGTVLFLVVNNVVALWQAPSIISGDTENHRLLSRHLAVLKTADGMAPPIPDPDPIPRSSLLNSGMNFLLKAPCAALNKKFMPSINNTSKTSGSEVNVIVDFGAKGDGITDDTQAIQEAVNCVYQQGGGTIVFPPGTYMVTSVTLKENIIYQGYGAIIKRPPNQDKWTRTFTTHYASNTNSQPLVIQGFIFDGNQAEQGAYNNYELEQAHLLFLMGDPDFPGRLQVVLEDCVFKNGVADGISVYTNVDIRVNDCEAINVFRGGFVLTGGNSSAEISNFTTQGELNPTGIDVEVDGRGYGNTLQTSIKLENINLIDGDFDIAVAERSTVIGRDITAGAPFTLYSLGSTMQFTHSKFKIGAADGYLNRILFPHHITFEDCEFDVTRKDIDNPDLFYAAADVWWQHPSQPTQRNQHLTFIDCVFQEDDTLRPTDVTYGIYLRSDAPSNHNQLLVQGSTFSDQFDARIMQEPH